MIRMRDLSTLLALSVVGMATAQVPTKCLEIESILVDACNPSSTCPGSSEGQNEMVRFRVGPAPIALSDLEADWPNGSWRGLVQNATTASITAQLNATIVSCGLLVEPPQGIMPAGAQVLMVTSTEMCVVGNSFAALADTLHIIFQDAGNTAGHFANSPAAGMPVSPTPPSGSGQRTLILFDNGTNCSDSATYVRELLVNTLGTYGGQSGESDGGTAEFSWPGVPQASYVNYGCQAPFTPLLVEAEAVGTLCGGTGTVSISAQVIGGAYTSVQWTGGTGTFADPNALATTYTAGAGDLGTVTLTLCAQTDCAAPICGSVQVPSGNGPSITITANGPLALCPGDQLVLTAAGADSYTWAGGGNGATLTVTTPGTYTVTGTNQCGTGQGSVEVTQASAVVVSISGDTEICPGGSTTLTASGASSYVWSTGTTGPSITVSATGTYSVTASSNCGTVTQSVTVSMGTAPAVSISGADMICSGASVTLTANSNAPLVWSTGDTGSSITVSTPGTFSVTATNGCGSSTASSTVVEGVQPTVEVAGADILCPGGSMVLTATANAPVTWNNGLSGSSITVNSPGLYVATATNACGTDTDGHQVNASLLTSAFTATPSSGAAPLQVQFNNTSAQGATSAWDFGGEGSSTATTPTFTFVDPGVYTVTLVTAMDGCTATSSVVVVVHTPDPGGASTIYVPNVFTPNGDRINDVLAIAATNIASLEVLIFNRWGEQVTELKRVGEVWDGRSISGNPVADGTYFYTLKARGIDGVDYDTAGHITVLR